MRARSDRGALEGYVALAMWALAGFTVLIALVASMFIRHEQARTAADFAALAAAQRQDCAAAETAARRNGALLQSCTLADAEAHVTVTAETGFGGFLIASGAPERYRASAHAAL